MNSPNIGNATTGPAKRSIGDDATGPAERTIGDAPAGPTLRLRSIDAGLAVQPGRRQVGVAAIHGRLPGKTTSIGTVVVAGRTTVVVDTMELRYVHGAKARDAAQTEQGNGKESAASKVRGPDHSGVHQNPPVNNTPV